MGYFSALSMASEAVDRASFRRALSWHFSSNCYPPIPQIMIQTAEHALFHYVTDRGDKPIPLPEGVSHLRYGTEVPARVIVDSYRLDAFAEVLYEWRTSSKSLSWDPDYGLSKGKKKDED